MKPYETLNVCGSEYHFKITAANAVRLEEELGTDLLTGLDKLAEIKVLARYLFYAAKSMNDDIAKIDDVYQLLDDYITDGGNFETLQGFVLDVLLVSGIVSEKVYDATKKVKEKQEKALQKILD